MEQKASSYFPPQLQSCRLYLGVWARVKRRLCRLMLRFINSFLKSSGEFRGDARGESLGELFGDPPGEPVLDLGMSWMMGSLVTLNSCGLFATSAFSSSELSEHRSLIVKVRYSVCWLRFQELSLICFLSSFSNWLGRIFLWCDMRQWSADVCGYLSQYSKSR